MVGTGRGLTICLSRSSARTRCMAACQYGPPSRWGRRVAWRWLHVAMTLSFTRREARRACTLLSSTLSALSETSRSPLQGPVAWGPLGGVWVLRSGVGRFRHERGSMCNVEMPITTVRDAIARMWSDEMRNRFGAKRWGGTITFHDGVYFGGGTTGPIGE